MNGEVLRLGGCTHRRVSAKWLYLLLYSIYT